MLYKNVLCASLVACLFLSPIRANAAEAQNAKNSEPPKKEEKGETLVTTKNRKNLNLVVYNQNFALVNDTRTIPFTKGINSIAFQNVSSQIKPETAVFNGDGVRVLEQNFNFDLLSRNSLLQKFLGKDIRVVSTNPATGKDTIEKQTSCPSMRDWSLKSDPESKRIIKGV